MSLKMRTLLCLAGAVLVLFLAVVGGNVLLDYTVTALFLAVLLTGLTRQHPWQAR
jgi:hypothetical protein